MQKSHVIKKKHAFKRVLARRRREKVTEELEYVFNDELHIQLPNDILPNEIRVNELRSQKSRITKKCAIMKW